MGLFLTLHCALGCQRKTYFVVKTGVCLSVAAISHRRTVLGASDFDIIIIIIIIIIYYNWVFTRWQ